MYLLYVYKMYVYVCEEYVLEYKLNFLRMQGIVYVIIFNLFCVFQMVIFCGMKVLFGLFSGIFKLIILNVELNVQIIIVSEIVKFYIVFDLLKF